MTTLANNQELYEYVISLATKLKGKGDEQLNKVVLAASRHVSGMRAEFLGEARSALRQVAGDNQGILDEEDLAELSSVLKQLDAAFKNR